MAEDSENDLDLILRLQFRQWILMGEIKKLLHNINFGRDEPSRFYKAHKQISSKNYIAQINGLFQLGQDPSAEQ